MLRVHGLPKDVAESELAGSSVAVIDLLRASTTICYALAAGATDVMPFARTDEAASSAAAARDRGEAVILGGERGGRRIEGFDLGNSPSEYTPQAVGGRRVFFTTTNGTRALLRTRQAESIVIAAAVNLTAVCDFLQARQRIDLLCAGTGGEVTREDVLLAGAICETLCRRFGSRKPRPHDRLSDFARSARDAWQMIATSPQQLVAEASVDIDPRDAGRPQRTAFAQDLRNTLGGRNLLAIGHDHDLETCAEIDRFTIVPRFDPASGRIFLP